MCRRTDIEILKVQGGTRPKSDLADRLIALIPQGVFCFEWLLWVVCDAASGLWLLASRFWLRGDLASLLPFLPSPCPISSCAVLLPAPSSIQGLSYPIARSSCTHLPQSPSRRQQSAPHELQRPTAPTSTRCARRTGVREAIGSDGGTTMFNARPLLIMPPCAGVGSFRRGYVSSHPRARLFFFVSPVYPRSRRCCVDDCAIPRRAP
jgi:hypothetical protein